MPSKRWQKELTSNNGDAVEYEDVDAETIKDSPNSSSRSSRAKTKDNNNNNNISRKARTNRKTSSSSSAAAAVAAAVATSSGTVAGAKKNAPNQRGTGTEKKE